MSEPIILQLNIRLAGIEPAIWRRLEIPEDATLPDLHDAIQGCMGWQDSHLHQFRIGRKMYGPRTGEEDFDDNTEDEEHFELSAAFSRKGSKVVYDYDFGDSWEHEVVLESKVKADADVEYPRCIAGERACPPEDCGGIPGYANLLQTLADPKHPDYEDMLQWLGTEHFDPEQCDLDEINERLAYSGDSADNDADYDMLGDAIVETVEYQVENNTPPDVRAALRRMAAEGLGEDDAWDRLAATYSFEVYRSFAEHRDFDVANYCRLLQALPALPDA